MIKHTTEYAKFKTVTGNREVIPGHVSRLVRSIQQNNLLPSNPIIINEKWEIIDGQHRLAASVILKLPIYYVVFNPASLKEIQLLNATMRTWQSKDFMESYVKMGNPNYIKFKEFLIKCELPFSVTLNIFSLGLEGYRNNRHLHQDFKEGKLVVGDTETTEEIIGYFHSLSEFIHPAVKSSNRYYDAVVSLLRHDPSLVSQLVKKCSESSKKIYRCDRMREYMRQFEDILNTGHYGKQIQLL